VGTLARGFNKVILMGNLTRDPDIRYTVDKRAMARFTLAVSRQWKDNKGELQENTDFIQIVVWGPQAQNCERYLSKGRPALVEGRLQVRNYEDKSGNRRFITEVVAQNVTFLGSKRDDYRKPDTASGEDSNKDFASMREKGFDDEDFPLDISEMEGLDESEEEEADIPF